MGGGAASAASDRPPAVVQPTSATELAHAGGVTIPPGVRLTIGFEGARAGGLAAVTITDDAEVVVRALRGATRFTTETDRLVVETDDASARIEIRVPRSAPSVEIQVGGRRVFLKDGPRIHTSAKRDESGTYLLSLAPGG